MCSLPRYQPLPGERDGVCMCISACMCVNAFQTYENAKTSNYKVLGMGRMVVGDERMDYWVWGA